MKVKPAARVKGKSILLAALIGVHSLMLTGCTVGPDYVRPELEIPTSYRLSFGEAETASAVRWWERFNDSELNRLIEIAIQENQDILIAVSRVREYEARYGISRSQLFPQVGAGGSYTRTKASERRFTSFPSEPFDDYVATLSASWELDFFGRIRRGNEAAAAQVLAQDSGRKAILLSVVSAVARTYVQLRGFDQQLQIAQATVASREQSLDIARQRFSTGLTSELDVRQAEAQLAAAKVTIPIAERLIVEAEDALSALIGRNPGSISRGVALPDLQLSGGIPVGLPSALLENRHDVVQAEEFLMAANAGIGEAKAEYFPRISLTGDAGYASRELTSWVSGPASLWAFGPTIDIPIFTAGRISNLVTAAEERRNQALLNYKKTIIIALQDVEDALIRARKTSEEVNERDKQVVVLRKYLSLAEQTWREGQSNYLEVLDAQRTLFEAELRLAESQVLGVNSLILLFSALGGGWVEEAASVVRP